MGAAGVETNLFLEFCHLVQNILVCLTSIAGLVTGDGIVFEPWAHELGSEIERVSEWLMHRVHDIASGHKHLLLSALLSVTAQFPWSNSRVQKRSSMPGDG